MRDWVHLAGKLKKPWILIFLEFFSLCVLGIVLILLDDWASDWAVSPFDTSLCPRIRCILPKSRKTRSETVSFLSLKDLIMFDPRKSEEYKKKKEEAKEFLYAAVSKQVPDLEDARLRHIFDIFSHLFSYFLGVLHVPGIQPP
jgi:hypothetical protein